MLNGPVRHVRLPGVRTSAVSPAPLAWMAAPAAAKAAANAAVSGVRPSQAAPWSSSAILWRVGASSFAAAVLADVWSAAASAGATRSSSSIIVRMIVRVRVRAESADLDRRPFRPHTHTHTHTLRNSLLRRKTTFALQIVALQMTIWGQYRVNCEAAGTPYVYKGCPC